MTVKVQLKQPLPCEGGMISELTIRTDIRLKDMRGVATDPDPVIQTERLLARLANVPPSTIAEMGMEDVAKVQEIIAPFLAAFQRTGPIS